MIDDRRHRSFSRSETRKHMEGHEKGVRLRRNMKLNDIKVDFKERQ